MRLTGTAGSDVGLIREKNEDSCCFDNSLGLFLVADGMGGHVAGEVASSLVVNTIRDYVRHFADKPSDSPDRYNFSDEDQSPLANTILQAIHLANQVVFSTAQKDEKLHNMGSTVVLIMADEDDLLVAHVGDSRAFRFRGGELSRLTLDHKLAEDPQFQGLINYDSTTVSTLGHTITRAMGIKEEVMPDLDRVPLEEDDIYLLCSDGLTDLVSEEMITQVLSLDEELDKKAKYLIELALAGGGKDNVTVALAQSQSQTKGKGLRSLFRRKS
ncbi:MAG: protein phosphatase 2C domain-containing protein [Candidatus Adiutricales bacterium]